MAWQLLAARSSWCEELESALRRDLLAGIQRSGYLGYRSVGLHHMNLALSELIARRLAFANEDNGFSALGILNDSTLRNEFPAIVPYDDGSLNRVARQSARRSTADDDGRALSGRIHGGDDTRYSPCNRLLRASKANRSGIA